jgi:2,5-dihydroxypyridine 5,6-dioxygenase
MSQSHDLLYAAEALLDFMALRRGEDVVISADTMGDARVAEALLTAAQRQGAKAVIATMSALPFQGQLANQHVPAALSRAVETCDLWIDLAFPYYAGAHVHDQAMKAQRARYLLVGDLKADGFQRMFGQLDFDAYFRAQALFDELFNASVGRTCRITTPLGTDVSFTLAKSTLHKPRRAERPGMYLVPGSCSIAPEVDSVRGRIVVQASFHEFYERLASPITLDVDGRINRLTGGAASRFPLDRALRRAGRGDYGSIIHFSHGLHPAARFTGSSFIEDMRAIGSNAVGLGIPWWLPGGGENHPDAVMTEHSVWLADEKIIDAGVIVATASLAQAAAALAPLGKGVAPVEASS